MAPRTHYAKSQEVVYKKMGTAARPKFKAVHPKLPGAKEGTEMPNTKSEPPAPPVIEPPHVGEDCPPYGLDEGPSFVDYEMPKRKKKVCLIL